MSQFAWFGIGLVLLLIIAQTDPQIGGWLLIVITMGLVYNAHQKGMV
jgi:hypothetical protein